MAASGTGRSNHMNAEIYRSTVRSDSAKCIKTHCMIFHHSAGKRRFSVWRGGVSSNGWFNHLISIWLSCVLAEEQTFKGTEKTQLLDCQKSVCCFAYSFKTLPNLCLIYSVYVYLLSNQTRCHPGFSFQHIHLCNISQALSCTIQKSELVKIHLTECLNFEFAAMHTFGPPRWITVLPQQ